MNFTAIAAEAVAPVSASDKLDARIAATADRLLLSTLTTLDAAPMGEAERLVYARVADELTRRWDMDAELDEVFMDLDFDGSYVDAIFQVLRDREAAEVAR